jgi:hypothetical protein
LTASDLLKRDAALRRKSRVGAIIEKKEILSPPRHGELKKQRKFWRYGRYLA